MYMEFRSRLIALGITMMILVLVHLVFITIQYLKNKRLGEKRYKKSIIRGTGICLSALGIVNLAAVFIIGDDTACAGIAITAASLIAGTCALFSTFGETKSDDVVKGDEE